jgi:hypothetical protein
VRPSDGSPFRTERINPVRLMWTGTNSKRRFCRKKAERYRFEFSEVQIMTSDLPTDRTDNSGRQDSDASLPRIRSSNKRAGVLKALTEVPLLVLLR